MPLPDDLVLVINLPAAAERRAFQQAQLGRLALPYRLMPAVTVADIPPADLQRLSQSWARPLRPTEVACTLSHRSAWERVARASGPRLILEDDAVLSPRLPALMAALMARADLDYVTLETYVRPKRLSRRAEALADTGFALSRLYRDRGGAAAYVLWPHGAERLLRATRHQLPLADAAIDLAPGLRRHQCEPAAAVQAVILAQAGRAMGGIAPSMIAAGGAPRPDKGGPAARLRFGLRRAALSLRQFARRLMAPASHLRAVPAATDIGADIPLSPAPPARL